MSLSESPLFIAPWSTKSYVETRCPLSDNWVNQMWYHSLLWNYDSFLSKKQSPDLACSGIKWNPQIWFYFHDTSEQANPETNTSGFQGLRGERQYGECMLMGVWFLYGPWKCAGICMVPSVQFCEYTKTHWIAQFERVTCMVRVFYLKRKKNIRKNFTKPPMWLSWPRFYALIWFSYYSHFQDLEEKYFLLYWQSND